jgi:thymidylate kinase
MIVLLEGLNCTGKTTLANLLQHHLNVPIIKFNVPGHDPYSEFKERVEAAVQEHGHFIVDRLHLSNVAYGGRLGGGVLTPTEWTKIDKFLCEQKAFLYWMLDTPQAIEERLKERTGRADGAQTMEREQIGLIHTRFQKAFDLSAIDPKGSFMLPQFYDDFVTPQFRQNVLLMKSCMAGMTT